MNPAHQGDAPVSTAIPSLNAAAASLARLGVPYVLTELPGALHGFLDEQDSADFHAAVDEISRWLLTEGEVCNKNRTQTHRMDGTCPT